MDQTPHPNPLPTSWGEGIGKSHGGGIKMRPARVTFWGGGLRFLISIVLLIFSLHIGGTEEIKIKHTQETEMRPQLPFGLPARAFGLG